MYSRCGLNCPGIELQWGENFRVQQTVLRLIQRPVQWVLCLSVGQGRRRVVLTTHRVLLDVTGLLSVPAWAGRWVTFIFIHVRFLIS